MNGLICNSICLMDLTMIFESSILQPLFWMIMGGLMILFFIGLTFWLKDLRIPMNWWKWVLTALWYIGVYVVIAGGFTLIGEQEVRAGFFFLGVFGTVMIILGTGLWRILRTNG